MRTDPDRRAVMCSMAAAAIAALVPAPAYPLPVLEQWVGPAGMKAIAAYPGILDSDGRLALSTAARADLTTFFCGNLAQIAVRLDGPRDADVLRAVLLHCAGLPASGVCVAPAGKGARRLTKT